MNTPNGLQEIKNTFGDITEYIDETGLLEPDWTTEYLTTMDLPFSIPLSWNKTVSVTRITCHKLLAQTFNDVFTKIQSQGLQQSITDYGGCFSYRQQRHSTDKLSTHAWGI